MAFNVGAYVLHGISLYIHDIIVSLGYVPMSVILHLRGSALTGLLYLLVYVNKL